MHVIIMICLARSYRINRENKRERERVRERESGRERERERDAGRGRERSIFSIHILCARARPEQSLGTRRGGRARRGGPCSRPASLLLLAEGALCHGKALHSLIARVFQRFCARHFPQTPLRP